MSAGHEITTRRVRSRRIDKGENTPQETSRVRQFFWWPLAGRLRHAVRGVRGNKCHELHLTAVEEGIDDRGPTTLAPRSLIKTPNFAAAANIKSKANCDLCADVGNAILTRCAMQQPMDAASHHKFGPAGIDLLPSFCAWTGPTICRLSGRWISSGRQSQSRQDDGFDDVTMIAHPCRQDP